MGLIMWSIVYMIYVFHYNSKLMRADDQVQWQYKECVVLCYPKKISLFLEHY